MKKQKKAIKLWGATMVGLSLLLININQTKAEVVDLTGSPTHIGTFEGSTTFATSSSNGVNPGLFIEVMDRYGNLKQYESEEGVVTVPNTKEGAYVTKAKFLGKTKYRDIDTNEILDDWEEGRDLKLESVKMPVLTTTGKNLFDSSAEIVTGRGIDTITGLPYNASGHSYTGFLRAKPNTTYTITQSHDRTWVFAYNKNKEYIGLVKADILSGGNFTTPNDTYYIRLDFETVNTSEIVNGVQLELGSTATSYEPYKSNILSTPSDLELRRIGDVQDTLNCLTGEVTERIGEIVLDGSSDEEYIQSDLSLNNTIPFGIVLYDIKPEEASINNKFITSAADDNGDYEHSYSSISPHTNKNLVWFFINKGKLSSFDISGFRQWLSQNPITVQYQLATESIKTVALNSTYTFGRVSLRDVYVDGDVKSLICSVNVPTESLSFVLDPNQEEGNQFIAPTFSLINETPTSIRVTLKSFEQETDVFNDVLPTEHSDWSQLDKEQSRDIALSLVPIASDGWLTVDETSRYVANHSSTVLGEIKAKSTVDLTFEALHGQAFTENLSPRYKLVFVFDF